MDRRGGGGGGGGGGGSEGERSPRLFYRVLSLPYVRQKQEYFLTSKPTT